MDSRDVVFVRNISMQAVVGLDCWHREKPQRVLVSVRVGHSLLKTADTDDISYTLDYRKIYNDAILPLGLERHDSLFNLAHEASKQIFLKSGGAAFEITVTLPNALLNSDVGVSITQSGTREGSLAKRSMSIKDLRIYCIIGVNPAERLVKQPVILSVTAQSPLDGAKSTNFQKLLGPMIKVCRCTQNGWTDKHDLGA
jgi:FolB domain-containing protein